MLNVNFASGFGSNHNVVLPETVYPPFSQVLVYKNPSEGTRIKLPNYVNTVRVYAWGGGGAGGGKGPGTLKVPGSPPISGGSMPGGTGGDGGFVQGDFPIPPGAILKVRVAGGGKNYGQYAPPTIPPDYGAGSGGGYSSVELPTTFPLYHLVVAGGGGGGGQAPTTTNNYPNPNVPSGTYYAGGDGGPAFANGAMSGTLTRAFGYTYNGLGGTLSAGGESGYIAIGSVPVPQLGPVYGPVYGPLSPTEGTRKQAESGGFLRAGGDYNGMIISNYYDETSKLTGYGGLNGGGNHLFGPVGNPSSPANNRESPGYPAWPGINFQPGSWYVGAGAGGAGYYGGGMASATGPGPLIQNFGVSGGGGGSSYINPTGTSTVMANTGPYTPNPYYSSYHTAALPNNTLAATGRGGRGYIEPYSPAWTAQHGGDGLVVIVY